MQNANDAGRLPLLIEGDAAIARSLCDGLEREGYTVAWKASGTEGMQHAREQNPHLIILDSAAFTAGAMPAIILAAD